MKFFQNWTGIAIDETRNEFEIPVNLPGNLQYDYAVANEWGDMNDGFNCVRYRQLEAYTWQYVTNFKIDAKNDEQVFFVSNGIDYKYSITINGNELLNSEGMFSKVELDITDYIDQIDG